MDLEIQDLSSAGSIILSLRSRPSEINQITLVYKNSFYIISYNFAHDFLITSQEITPLQYYKTYEVMDYQSQIKRNLHIYAQSQKGPVGINFRYLSKFHKEQILGPHFSSLISN